MPSSIDTAMLVLSAVLILVNVGYSLVESWPAVVMAWKFSKGKLCRRKGHKRKASAR